MAQTALSRGLPLEEVRIIGNEHVVGSVAPLWNHVSAVEMARFVQDTLTIARM